MASGDSGTGMGVNAVRIDGIFGTDGISHAIDRKSTRLNSSHSQISYAVFCLKKKNISPRMLDVIYLARLSSPTTTSKVHATCSKLLLNVHGVDMNPRLLCTIPSPPYILIAVA